MAVIDKILSLTKRLYPKGRAFNIRVNSYRERLHKALSISEEYAHNDALSVLDSILPDNDNFTIQDASRWEERLGMINGSNVPLADRKLAIARKMNHPGTIPARQSADYLEQQLRDAGFDVYVYRSEGMGIEQVLNLNPDIFQMGDAQLNDFQLADIHSIYSQNYRCSILNTFELGEGQLSSCWWDNGIANYIDENLEQSLYVSHRIPWSFYIGGNPLGSYADVDINRRDEFRQLILRLKPVNSAGLLFINYI